MITKLSPTHYSSFIESCKIEPIFGSKISVALDTYSYDNPLHNFYLYEHYKIERGTAIYLANKVAVISSSNEVNVLELADFLKSKNVKEINTNYSLCEKLKGVLGGDTQSSFFMKYTNPTPPSFSNDGITPTNDLDIIFNILKESHEFYHNHLNYEKWSNNINAKLLKSNTFLVILTKDNEPIGTGSIISENEDCGVLAEIAVIPKERGNGYGKQIISYLTSYILQKGKTPMLMSGYDEVANLYRKLGYKDVGRWGELYL